jgi:hypothetical protein
LRLHSYVVRYDSGFAPNPFYGYCTLATCKPTIRKSAQIDDWIVGCGSNEKSVRRGGHLVYAMRVTEALDFRSYSLDARFQRKIPYRRGSRKQSCGDNIYLRDPTETRWLQRDSFHRNLDGTENAAHIKRDTGVNRVLVSDDFVYFGGSGPQFSPHLRSYHGVDVCKHGIGVSSFTDPGLIAAFVAWIRSFGAAGYQHAPLEWMMLRTER